MQVNFINNQLKSRGIISESLGLDDLEGNLSCFRGRLEEIDSIHDKIEELRQGIQRVEAENEVKRRHMKHLEFQLRQKNVIYTKLGLNLDELAYRKEVLQGEKKGARLEGQEAAIELSLLKARTLSEINEAENTETPVVQVTSRGGFFSVPGPLSLVHQSVRPTTAKPLESDINEVYQSREMELKNEIRRLYEFVWKQVPELSTIIGQVNKPSIDDLKRAVRSMLDLLEKNHMRPKGESKTSFEHIQAEIEKFERKYTEQQMELERG